MTRHPPPRPLFLATALLSVGAACVNLPDKTTVKDLRVLSVTADKPGFLVNLDNPGAAADADLQAVLTALVVDPNGAPQEVTFSAAGCPDYLDTITAASTKGTNLCPSPGATSNIPPPFGSALMTAEIVPQGSPASVGPANPAPGGTADAAVDIEYHPALPAFGFSSAQLGLFFSAQPFGVPQIDQAIQDNRDFGIDALVNIYFTLGAEQATVLKRIVYWPDLSAAMPGEVPNANPTIDHLAFYKRRDGNYGLHDLPSLDPADLLPAGMTPSVSIAAKDKLYVLPVPAADAAQMYPLRVREFQTMQIVTQFQQEVLVFDFFTTAGTFAPGEQESRPPVILGPGAPVHLDSELVLPKTASDIPASGQTDIWVVVHDERAGESWTHAVVNITP
jgi:hypothetical protein